MIKKIGVGSKAKKIIKQNTFENAEGKEAFKRILSGEKVSSTLRSLLQLNK